MWNETSNFDEDSDRGGGGFVKSPGNYGSQNESGDKKKFESKQQNLIPCTIAQIHSLPPGTDTISLGSIVAHIITVVGLVTSVEEVSTKIMFKLDDMTSEPLLVQLWIGDINGEGKNRDSRSKILENSYVRVTGTLRSVAETRQLIAFNISTITDYNEVTTHMLEIMHSRMAVAMMEQCPTGVPPPQQLGTFATNTAKVIPANYIKPRDGPTPVMTGIVQGLNPQQNMVLQAIMPIKDEDGTDLDYLVSVLPSMNRSTIKTIVDFLSNEGHIYTTRDDDHFKAIDF